MGIDIKALISQLEGAVADAAKTNFKEFSGEATTDAKQLFDILKDDLKQWAQELSNNEISADDFKDLLLGDKDLVQMNALKQSGIAKVKIDQFKDNLFKLIADTTIKVISHS